tara:strand:- start:246 stop:908 length:663 start_codon:yes stop_codon:yes gene_type:complete
MADKWNELDKMELVLAKGLANPLDKAHNSLRPKDYRGSSEWRLFACSDGVEIKSDSEADFNNIALYAMGIINAEEAGILICDKNDDVHARARDTENGIPIPFILRTKPKDCVEQGVSLFGKSPVRREAIEFEQFGFVELLQHRDNGYDVFGIPTTPFPMVGYDYRAKLKAKHSYSIRKEKVAFLKGHSSVHRGEEVDETLKAEGLEQYLGFCQDFREKYS